MQSRLIGLLIALLLLAAGPLRADDEFGFILGEDEFDEEIFDGEVHRYLVQLTQGTDFELRVRSEAFDEERPDEEEDENPDKKGDDGPGPEVAVLSPVDAELFVETGADVEFDGAAGSSGNHVIEVRSNGFEGTYRVEFDSELPDSTEEVIAVEGIVRTIHLDFPPEVAVEITIVRFDGIAPDIRSIRDGTGESVGFEERKRKNGKGKVWFHPVPVPTFGGLDVAIAGPGLYEVSVEAVDEDEEAPDDADEDEHIERLIVLQLAPGVDPEDIAEQLDWEVEDDDDGGRVAVLETPEGREGFEEQDAATAALLPGVVSAEPLARVRVPEGSQSNAAVLGSDLGRAQFDSQQALAQVKAARAHRRSTGRTIVVAVLDTGIDREHPLFAGRLHTVLGSDTVDRDDDPTDVADGADQDSDGVADDAYGHGTFVAGLVLAAAPDAIIMPIRVLDAEGQGRVDDIVDGIELAVEERANVINLSLGMRSRSAALRAAVLNARAAGVVVVASAGNGGRTDAVDYPAGVDGVIAVSALDGGRRASFANATRATDVSAPGTGLIGPFPDSRWATWSGTSFATALVSGGVAVHLQGRPATRPAVVLKKVRRSAKRLRRVPAADRKRLGGGLLNLAKLSR